jgi:hypothetical protein
MEKNLSCKQITFSQPEGSRKKGRPKLRWLDSVLNDVKLLKVETWWKKARDKNIWGRNIKEAKVNEGLLRQKKKKKVGEFPSWSVYLLHVPCDCSSGEPTELHVVVMVATVVYLTTHFQ